MSDDEDARKVARLARRLGKVLAGNPPNLQGGAIAWATAMWLAGHRSADLDEQTAMRSQLLTAQIESVLTMIPVAEAEIDAMLSRNTSTTGRPGRAH